MTWIDMCVCVNYRINMNKFEYEKISKRARNKMNTYSDAVIAVNDWAIYNLYYKHGSDAYRNVYQLSL